MPKPSGFTYERRRAMRELGKLLKANNQGAVIRALVDDLRASFGSATVGKNSGCAPPETKDKKP